ncbi:MAG: TIGR01212 family radical SAM protein [Bacteroidota bacterium]
MFAPEMFNNRRFNTFAAYCLKTYGTRLQKLSIDAGFTCPNRDGTIARNGCTYCCNDAFNPSYCQPEKNITQQIDEGIDFHKTRYRRATKYIAYFQPYSNTYKELEKLKKIYGEALAHPMISGISIGTRPDCVDDKKLDFLAEIAKTHFVSVEYGIESCYNRTLTSINRGHSFELAKQAIRQTAARNLFVGAHIIFGLPGESRLQMLAEAAILSALPINSLKLHQLQILKNTTMESEFKTNPKSFHLFGLDEYIDFIMDFLELLHPDIIIERLSGEVPPRFLTHSSWGLIRTDQVLVKIENQMKLRNTWQGKLFRK